LLSLFNFISCSLALTLVFPTLDIRSFKDSHITHFAKVEPLFYTSTFRWYFLLNQLIVDWNTSSIFNSLLIYNITPKKKKFRWKNLQNSICINKTQAKKYDINNFTNITRMQNLTPPHCSFFKYFSKCSKLKVEHLVYHSQFPSFGVALHQHTN